jgi:preprotein translocase subunit Sec63
MQVANPKTLHNSCKDMLLCYVLLMNILLKHFAELAWTDMPTTRLHK